MRWLIIAALAVVSGAASSAELHPGLVLNAPDRTRLLQPPGEFREISLTSHTGRPYTLFDQKPHPVLLFFGFTHCRNICPTTLDQLREVRQSLAGSTVSPEVIFISVDGERDDVATVNRYIQRFGDGFTGLTDSPDRIQPIAAGLSAVFFRGMATDSEGGYDVQHTSQVYLISKAGKVVAVFYNAPAADILSTLKWIEGQP